MTAPETIWIDPFGGKWSHSGDGTQQEAYRRADLPATDAQVLANPKVRALVDAAAGYRRAVDAFDGTGGMSDKIARVQAWRDALDAALAALDASPAPDPAAKPGCCQPDGDNANG